MLVAESRSMLEQDSPAFSFSTPSFLPSWYLNWGNKNNAILLVKYVLKNPDYLFLYIQIIISLDSEVVSANLSHPGPRKNSQGALSSLWQFIIFKNLFSSPNWRVQLVSGLEKNFARAFGLSMSNFGFKKAFSFSEVSQSTFKVKVRLRRALKEKSSSTIW